jgi:uncharacterized protein (TIGR02569 family)
MAPVSDRFPQREVISAFGCDGPASRFDGGQGSTFVVGEVVLKPAVDHAQAAWVGEVLSTVAQESFRMPRPIKSRDGRWVVDGWTAFERVEGEHRLWGGPWAEAVDVCGRFHSALAHLPRPAFLQERTDRFAEADHLAWHATAAASPAPLTDTVNRLRSMSRPVRSADQLIHGDFAGNLLFATGLPPAVIDFSPYWRPAGYAIALTIVDAILWYGQGVRLTARAAHVPELDQLLLRALLFRLTLDGLLLQHPASGVRWEPSQIDWDLTHAEPLVAHLAGRCSSRGEARQQPPEP